MVSPVGLTDSERELFDLVNFDERALADMHPDDPDAMFAASMTLTRCLLDRDAIPRVRIRYFDNPELNIGGHGKSRYAEFARNGCRGEDMLRDPHFFKHLRYFVLGPDLPSGVINGFRQIVVDDRGTSGEILDQLCKFARAQTRRLRTSSHSDLHEEFFKLAIECGVRDGEAEAVRRASQSAR